MKSNIEKYKAKLELEKHLHNIEELKSLNNKNDDFDIWLESVTHLIEDLFSKDSRQFIEFTKIKFHPGFLFLGDPSNEIYEQNSYNKGLLSTQNYLEELIKYINEYWDISVDYENIKAIKPNVPDPDFAKLAKSIRENIENNEPEIALDRLHTFLIKYFREVNTRHQLNINKEIPLHSLFGSYIKYLVSEKKINSKMSELIMKSSISILDSFNDIRNNKSFAHDNKILGYNESLFIFNNISNLVQYVSSIEGD